MGDGLLNLSLETRHGEGDCEATTEKYVHSQETITLCRKNVVNRKDIFKNHEGVLGNMKRKSDGSLSLQARCRMLE